MAVKFLDTIWVTHGINLIGFVKIENEAGQRKIYSGIVGPPHQSEELDAKQVYETGGKVEPELFKDFLELDKESSLGSEPHDEELLKAITDELAPEFGGGLDSSTLYGELAMDVAKRYFEKRLRLKPKNG